MGLQARGTDICSPHTIFRFSKTSTHVSLSYQTSRLSPQHLVDSPTHGGSRLRRTAPTEENPIGILPVGYGRASDISSPPLPKAHALGNFARDGSTMMPVKLLTACAAQDAFHSPGSSHKGKRPPSRESATFVEERSSNPIHHRPSQTGS